MTFKDPSLFRQAALIGGEWIEADAANAIEVTNPARRMD
ncbi:Succinate-semialdehyde dehydrogenase [NADP(+)] GabD [Ensifer adhaerens]|nr:Succinate-semialdehyde dehydrogenase [NADP(+)] GabD [Ensifer adhaerens]